MERLLKNGSREDERVVNVLIGSLNALGNQGIQGVMALADLHEKMQNPEHTFHPNSIVLYEQLNLMQNGGFHDSFINVVQSALTVDMEQFSVNVGNPYAES